MFRAHHHPFARKRSRRVFPQGLLDADSDGGGHGHGKAVDFILQRIEPGIDAGCGKPWQRREVAAAINRTRVLTETDKSQFGNQAAGYHRCILRKG